MARRKSSKRVREEAITAIRNNVEFITELCTKPQNSKYFESTAGTIMLSEMFRIITNRIVDVEMTLYEEFLSKQYKPN